MGERQYASAHCSWCRETKRREIEDVIRGWAVYTCEGCGYSVSVAAKSLKIEHVDDPRKEEREAREREVALGKLAASDSAFADLLRDLRRVSLAAQGRGESADLWEADAERARRDELRALVEQSRLPEVYLPFFYGDVPLQRSEACSFMQQAEHEGWKAAIMLGDSGSGKSLAAAAAVYQTCLQAWQRFDSQPGVLWYRTTDLARIPWWETDKARAAEIDALRRTLARVPLLVLDDCGQEPASTTKEGSWWRAELWSMIDARWTWDRTRTYITTRKSTDELRRLYGEDVMRRILEHAGEHKKLLRGTWRGGKAA